MGNLRAKAGQDGQIDRRRMVDDLDFEPRKVVPSTSNWSANSSTFGAGFQSGKKGFYPE
jgi:hypothetical protein